MSGEKPQPNPIVRWVQGHQIASAFIALGFLVLFALALSSLPGEDSAEVAISETTTTSAALAPATGEDVEDADPDRPEVPQVDCRILLSEDEIDEALFGPDPSGSRGTFTFAQGETCRYEPSDESGNYIQIEPGHPTDFDAGAGSETIDGVGDDARWSDDGRELGVLSVGANVPDASLIYRIHVGRSDLDGAQRLALATELALLALPRFPGTPPEHPPPLVDLCELVPDEQAEQILAAYRDAHPATRNEVQVTDNFSDLVDLSEEGDANCRKLILAEIYIETQQGSPGDFEDGARMEGVVAEPVEGLGFEAVWFANVPYRGTFAAPHERGVLGVRLGDATFRIVLAVPDTPSGDQLGIVKDVARGAVGRIPGIPTPELEPEVVTFDEEPPELPPQDLYEVVYARVDSGEWTEGEGLIQALGWLLGDAPDLVDADFPDSSGTAVIRAAQAYAASDSPEASEVQRLLDELVVNLDDLDQISVPAGSAATGLLVSAAPVAQTESGGCPGGAESCFIQVPPSEFEDVGQDKFKAYVLLPSGWGLDGLDSPAIDAFHDAVVVFEAIGAGMPPTGLVLDDSRGSWASYDPESVTCTVGIGDNWVNGPTDDLLFTVARETAHCFINFDLFPQLSENPTPWLEEGLAVHLGGFVYSTLNVEHKALPGLLAREELYTTMLQRASTNWAFFEYLHSRSGVEAVMNLLRGLPESGDLAGALAGVPIVEDAFHELGQALSDSSMPDVGGGNVPYGPESWQVILAGPKTFDGSLTRFSAKRYRLEVPSGRYACGVTVTSDGVRLSWRTGAPGVPGSWSENVPDPLQDVSVLLVTSVEDGGSFSFEVEDVGDNPDCEDEDNPQGDLGEAILELCELICDPSGYYWKPQGF